MTDHARTGPARGDPAGGPGPGRGGGDPGGLGGGRVALSGTLLWAMTASTIGQYALGTLAPFLTADVGASRTELGVLATVYIAVGAVIAPLTGRVVDRTGARRMLLVLFALSAAGLVGLAAGPTLPWLVAAAAVAGVASAMNNPVTNTLIAERLPAGGRGVVMGVKQSGVQVGAFLAGAVLPPLALWAGWRAALLVAAGSAALGVVLAVVGVPPDSPTRRTPAPREDRPPRLEPLVRWVAAYALLMGAGVAAVGTFLVLYGVEALGLSAAAAGWAAALAGLVGIAARIVWGHAAERLRTASMPLGIMAAAATVSQALILSAAAVGTWALWLGAVGYGLSAGAWNAVANLAIVREVPAASSGTASGVVQAAFYWGIVTCPVLFGLSVDRTGSYQVGWAAMTLVFAAATVLSVVWHRRHARVVAPAT